MTPDLTFDDAARTLHPLGIECGHCIRRVLLHSTAFEHRKGDRRRLALRCSKCGSRNFTATLFASRAKAITFVRNH